ncbi:MAG: hypothetical protein J6N49_02640, partial [Alphaproteobacteria bacterium]|nr:hypothetical protein [Alphaproteobacteria bacterium]
GKGVATGLTSGGNAKVGDIVSKASAGAAGAVNAAQSGNWGQAISEAGAGTGGALQAGGLKTAGALAGSAGNTVGGAVGKVQEGGSLVDMGKNIAEDGKIKSEAEKAYNAYKNIRKTRQAKKTQAEQK